MVTASSVKFSSVTYKIFPSKTGEPSRSTFDAQSLLFGLPSRHDCGNTTISFVLLCVGTIWAAKHRTKVHYYAKTSRLPWNRSSDTYDFFWCLSSTSRNHVTWRHVWYGSRVWLMVISNFKHLRRDQNWWILFFSGFFLSLRRSGFRQFHNSAPNMENELSWILSLYLLTYKLPASENLVFMYERQISR